MSEPEFTIVSVADGGLSEERLTEVEAIFFEASGRSFAPGPEREAFRERWLGRYLHGGGDVALLALDRSGKVAGYVIGALTDPATQDRFADIPYFRGDFREQCRRFPAHLHINLGPAFRSLGLGARLIDAFAARAAAAGAPGLHVVTGSAMRNVRFYRRCGFAQEGEALFNGRKVVFLARALRAPA
jgi:GNAT superfamily N-acetyltransferase